MRRIKHIDFDFPGFDRSTPRSIEEDQIEIDPLTISPNPSSDFISVDLSKIDKVSSLSIISINGKEMHRETLNDRIENKTVDISRLPIGLYIVRVQTSDGIIHTKKLVKTRS